MDDATIDWILQKMQGLLNKGQAAALKNVLKLLGEKPDNKDIDPVGNFLAAKEVEGCSPKTVVYYRRTLQRMVEALGKPAQCITTEDLRGYLMEYERERSVTKTTIDNVRRILNSFFSWLEDEDYVVKSPMRRIHHVKAPQRIGEVFSEEDLERLRSACSSARDLALIGMLATTGMRVGELVGLDVRDVNLTDRECIVIGKGDKQRPAYFDTRTMLDLKRYLANRSDGPLFPSTRGGNRLSVGMIERIVRRIGNAAEIVHAYPHRFRRTLATRAIDKGMPIEQVQKMLGHARIDTTMHYALVNQSNVRASHRKYLE